MSFKKWSEFQGESIPTITVKENADAASADDTAMRLDNEPVVDGNSTTKS